MREEEGTFQDLRPAGRGGDARGPVSGAGRARSSARVLAGGTGGAGSGAGVELVQRSSGQILDTAIELARDRLGLYVLAASAVWFLVRVLEPFFIGAQLQEAAAMGDLGGVMGIGAVFGAATWFVHQLATLVVAALAWPRVVGQPEPIWKGLLRALAAAVPVFLLYLLTLLAALFGGACTCGIGLVYIAWKTALVPVCYVIEGAGLAGSVTRSWRLASSETLSSSFVGFLRWLAVVGTGFLVYRVFSEIGGAFNLPAVRESVLDGGRVPVWLYDTTTVVLASTLSGFGSALFGIVLLAYYLDCRVRRDGFDLRRRLEDLQAEWAGRAPEAVPSGGALLGSPHAALPPDASRASSPLDAPRTSPSTNAPRATPEVP